MFQNCHTTIQVPPPLRNNPLVLEAKESLLPVTDPRFWGPSFWFFIHLASLKGADLGNHEAREKIWGFIQGLPWMLPCKDCQEHAKNYVALHATKDMLLSQIHRYVQESGSHD